MLKPINAGLTKYHYFEKDSILFICILYVIQLIEGDENDVINLNVYVPGNRGRFRGREGGMLFNVVKITTKMSLIVRPTLFGF